MNQLLEYSNYLKQRLTGSLSKGLYIWAWLPWYSSQWDRFFLRSYGCLHPTSPGKNLFSSHLTGTKLTNKLGAVYFDTGGYTWYCNCCHSSELINVELTFTILQNTTSGTAKGLNRQNILISVMRMTRSYGKFSSHFTEIPHMYGGISPNPVGSFPYQHEMIFPSPIAWKRGARLLIWTSVESFCTRGD